MTVNGAARGLAATRIESVTSGTTEVLAPPLDRATPFTPIPPTTPRNARVDWIIGPFEIAPTDNVAVGYSGTNYSDWESGTNLHRHAGQDHMEAPPITSSRRWQVWQ